ncbi:hypothetical protein [Brevibacillus laterosporus]|uniref:hypothetical protein n=1 Tax=Brevibacillus laterosporus TaxID=1465 RepID=UPI0018CDADEA|nr:hypothetical protein [Brevibacillus laterosporus]
MAYVWEYVKTPHVASTIDLVSTHKYRIQAVSSHSYGIRIYGTKKTDGQEELLFSTEGHFMLPLDVSGALYGSVRIANDLTGGTTGLYLDQTILLRMPNADNDRDNPYNVWEYIYLPYATRTVNIESTHKYRFTAYSSLNYGLRFYGVRRSDGKEQLLLETERTFDTLETSGALYSSIRISDMHGNATGLLMNGHLLLRMPLNSAPILTLTANNQLLTKNQRIYTGTNDFTVNITANDVDPDDTLQYQVKLNNVVKKDWTAISRNLPVSYTFKKADYINDSNPFIVSVRDNNGAITTFEAALVKYERPEYLGLVKLGTLRKGTTALPRPTLPWYPGGEPFPGCGSGNIPEFNRDILNWNIGDTDTSEANQLYWHKIIDGSKTILICDRVILMYVTWSDLDKDNRVFGKNITIDGKQYRLRLLTCGYNEREDLTGGYPENNEWDRFILNDDSINGLPKPESTDRDHALNSTDKYSKHNQFWNWFGIYTLGQETYIKQNDYRAIRGYIRAPRWGRESYKTPVLNIGWRPVLEVLNQPPTLSLKTPSNNQTLTENDVLIIKGTVSDADKDNVVVTKYRINNGTTRAIASGVSDGSSPISFAKSLLFQNKRLYDGTTDITGIDLAENTDHILTIWAEDDQGGKSDVVTRTFTVKHNKAPILTVGTFPAVQSGLIPPDSITLSGTASDPDGNTITVKGKLNSGTEQTVLSGVASGNWLYSFKVSDLKAGANTVTITATDQFGLSTVKTFNVNNAVTETPMKKAVARYKILAPKGSAREILAWLKREKGDFVVDAETSFVDKGLPEQYTAMTKESVDLTTSITEDELISTVSTAKSDVTFKLTLSRTNTSTKEAAVMLVGVIS